MFDYQVTQLDSGLRVVTQTTDTNVAYCGVMVGCGTRHEVGEKQWGMAHFVEHILFKGTSHLNSWHINNRMESVGGELNAFTTKEDTTFYSVFLPKDFARACQLICDLVCHPTAPQHELEKEREVIVEEIESYRDTPSELIYDEFENRLFTKTALGHNILGNEATLRTFDSAQCLDFINSNYLAGRMVFFAYGPMKHEQVVKAVARYMDDEVFAYRQQQAERLSVGKSEPLVQGVGTQEVDWSDHIEKVSPDEHHQSHCILGCPSYPIGHPNAAALSLINNMLGGPGMNSRLNLELREKRGMVYTVESTLTSFTDCGYFSIYFGCDPHDSLRGFRLCERELERFVEKPLSQRQLLAAQKQLKGQFGIATANLENNALSLAKNLMRLGKIEDLEQTYQRIDQVTVEQVQQVAAEVFARRMKVIL